MTPRSAENTVRRIEVGRAPTGATIVVKGPLDHRRPAVLFLPGWRLMGPEAYRAWTNHLARAGNVVIVPRYQVPRGQALGEVLPNAVAGIRAALRRVRVDPSTMVVAGHSVGAALAADYASIAKGARLPEPRAIFALYPGRAIRTGDSVPEYDASQIPPETRIVALAGSRDAVVGEAPAAELLTSATAVRAPRRKLVRIVTPGSAGHFDPVLDRPAVRREIWRRLDRLIAVARGSP